jgi:hypothetical protein
VSVEVPARDNEDIIAWVEQTGLYVAHSHRQQSPHCRSNVCDLMVPLHEKQPIGKDQGDDSSQEKESSTRH